MLATEELRILNKILPYREGQTGSTFPEAYSDESTGFTQGLRPPYSRGTTIPPLYERLNESIITSLALTVESLRTELNHLKKTSQSGQIEQDQAQLLLMKRIAEFAMRGHPGTVGSYAAITFSGDIVAVANDLVGLFKEIHSRTEDIFVWKIGSGPVDSW